LDPLPPAGAASVRSVGVLSTLYFFSGATGLCYEVLWARMVGAQFGVSTFGVAATVAAFLLGLGLGAAAGGRAALAWSPAQALRRYAMLEGIVAAYALLLPALAGAGGPLLDSLAPQLSWWQWCAVQGLTAIALLALPAAAMGASFPVVLRALPNAAPALGRLYAANTFGAAAGAVLALALLATVGWMRAVQAVALGGALISGAALLASRKADAAPVPRLGTTPPQSLQAPQWRALLAYAAVGACALMLEIAWTRLYGIVLLRSEYVLAVILAVYLLGTALGSRLAARSGQRLLSAIPLVACAGILLGVWALAPLSSWLQGRHFASLAAALGVQALALAACTLPVTCALGAWLPALARADQVGQGSDGAADVRPHGTLLYGANCLGGAIGALLSVFLCIPLLGTVGTVVLAAVLMLLLGPLLGASRGTLAALAPAIVAAFDLHAFPPPQRMLGPQAEATQERYRYEDALSLSQVVETPDGQRILLTDLQHLDASSDPAAVQLQADQARLPLLLHRAPGSVLFLGLGTGISASGSLAYPGLQRTAVEISPGAIAAAGQWFAPVNGAVMTQTRVAAGDARHFLAASKARYDVIVGDLFHPDIAGMGNLLSVEQFARARHCLAPGGLFVQWLAINQFDRESLHTVLRSFGRVFPDGQLFLDGAHLALVGSLDPLAQGLAARLAGMDPLLPSPASGGEGAATWLGRYWGPVGGGTGPVQTEAQPVIEFRLPRLRYGGADEDDAAPVAEILRELLRQRPAPDEAARRLGLEAGQLAGFSSAYAASELYVQSWLATLDGDERRARQRLQLAFEANPQDRWIASELAEDQWQAMQRDGTADTPEAIERVLRIYPEHVAALRAAWHRAAQGHAPDAAAARERLRRVAPLDRELAGNAVRLP